MGTKNTYNILRALLGLGFHRWFKRSPLMQTFLMVPPATLLSEQKTTDTAKIIVAVLLGPKLILVIVFVMYRHKKQTA